MPRDVQEVGIIVNRPHGGEVHALQVAISASPGKPDDVSEKHTKYPVKMVKGRKMIVANVKRRMTSFISYEAIYKTSDRNL